MVHTVFKTVIRDKGDERHSQGCLTLFDQRCPRKKGVESEESAAENFHIPLQNNSKGQPASWLGLSQQQSHSWYKFSEFIIFLVIVLKHLTRS